MIKELHISGRAIIVVEDKDRVRYAEYVSEVVNHPDYEKALAAAKSLV